MESNKGNNKKKLSGKLLIFITALLFVCTIIFLNAKFSSVSLKKIAYWVFNGVSGDTTEASMKFDANEYNRFTLLNGSLCVISPELLSAYKISGSQTLSESALLRSPAIETSDSVFLAYDLGGTNFYIANTKELLHSGSSEYPIINVNMNENGYFAIVSDNADSKSLVTVYDNSYKPIYKFFSSEKYVFDAAVSPNGKKVAVLTYGASDGFFGSKLSLGEIDSDGFYANLSLDSSMPLDIAYTANDEIVILCDDRLVFANSDGEITSSASFNGLQVKGFSDISEKYIAVLLDEYQNGGNSKLLVVKNNGETIGELGFSEDIFSVSTAGNYISVQFSDKCTVYKNDLSVYADFQIPTTVTRCFVNSDGTLLSIGDNFAALSIA